MFDITAIGELLIDFTPVYKDDIGYPKFEQNPGGAPANMLVCASKLGLKTCFIGKVGLDNFGNFLKNVLDDADVDTKGLVLDKKYETTLAFVHLDKNNNRSFSFYRLSGADKFLNKEEIDFHLIENTKILHFGTVSLSYDPCRSATIEAVNYAIKKKKIISLDVNFRKPLWNDTDKAIEYIKKSLFLSHIVKLSEEELELVTCMKDIEKSIEKVICEYPNICILAITLGEKGCYVSNRNEYKYMPANTKINKNPINVVDTTGAGDCFTGAFIYHIMNEFKALNEHIEEIDIDVLEKAAIFANKAASICITKKGGIPSMPSMKEIEDI